MIVQHIHPVPPLDAKKLARLFAELDDDSFDVRENATAELKKAGESIEEDLHRERKRSTSAEVRRRLTDVLAELDRTVAAPTSRALASRALLVLEQAGTADARRRWRNWRPGRRGPGSPRKPGPP